MTDETSLERYGIRINASFAGDDAVNHPKHYQLENGMEVIDFINAAVTDSESYYVGNILKYVCRYREKNGIEDLKKAAWYLNELIEMKGAKVFGK